MKIIQSYYYLTFTANVPKIFLIEHCLEKNQSFESFQLEVERGRKLLLLFELHQKLH